MKYKLALVLVLTLTLNLTAQNPSEDFLGSWYTYGSSHRLNERFSLAPYGELRFYEASSNYNLMFLSLSGTYHFNPKAAVGMGYAYLDIDTVFEFDDEPNVYENRLFERYIYRHRLGQFKIVHRAQFEQRFLDFRTRNELQNRFRYRLSLRYDFNKTLFALVSEEPFVNFQDQVFHENRFYAGIGIKLSQHAQLSLGYLKQHIRKNNLNRIQVGISFKTDSRKSPTNLSQL